MPHFKIFFSVLILIIGSYSISHTLSLNKKFNIPFLKAFNRFIIVFNLYFLLQTILEYLYVNIKPGFSPKIFLKIGIYSDLFFSVFMIFITLLLLENFSFLPVKLFNKYRVKLLVILLFVILFSIHLYYILFKMSNDNKKTFLLIMLMYVFIFHFTIMILLIKTFFSSKNHLSKKQKSYLNIFSSVFFLIKSASVIYLFLLYFGIYSFNLTFYLVFFLYNLFPLIYMKDFLLTLFPEEVTSAGSEDSINENIKKYGISKREQEIIFLIFDGLSNKAIEERLYISIATVKDHIYNIYKKTGVKNRVQLVNLFSKKNN